MFKKLFLFLTLFLNIFFVCITNAATRQVWDSKVKDRLLWISENDVLASDGDGLYMLDTIFIWIKDSLTWLLVLIAIWAFLFIWIRLAFARWNPEEFKKSMMQLTYAIVWLFIVSFAWAAVKLVAWLNF